MERDTDLARGIRNWMVRWAISLVIIAACLFLSAGRWDWKMGWAYLITLVVRQAITTLILVRVSPDLMAERAGRPDLKEGIADWDRVLARLSVLGGSVVLWIVAGLEVRYGWSSQIAPPIQIAALLVATLGGVLSDWAMVANRFFSSLARIQRERGHTVVSSGPYRYVRHPGYLGWIIHVLTNAPALGSLWAFVPAGITAVLVVLRTALEDRMLQAHLEGYADYGRRVKYRLMPGIW